MWVHRGFVRFFHPPQATVNPSFSPWMPEAAAAWMPRALSILSIRGSDRLICNPGPPERATDLVGDVQPEHVGGWEGASERLVLGGQRSGYGSVVASARQPPRSTILQRIR